MIKCEFVCGFYDSFCLLFIFSLNFPKLPISLGSFSGGGFNLMTMMVCIFFLLPPFFSSTDIFTDFLLHYIREKLFNLLELSSFFLQLNSKTIHELHCLLRKIPYKFDMIFISSHRQFDFCLES